jgi:hypothetical protein
VKQLYSLALGLALAAPLAAVAQAQPLSSNSDLYHVHFTKAVPGQATALADLLKKPDTSSPMPDHFVVLRHQQGDDWDYVVIQHLGAKATVDPAGTPPNAGRDIRAWHADTFASGPSWGEFTKAMGIGQSTGSTGGSVYSVAVWRAAAGHREPLEKLLREAPAGAAGAGSVVLTHVEGGPWTFLAIDRYASWDAFGKAQAASADDAGWARVREHGTYHHDTVADRIAPR